MGSSWPEHATDHRKRAIDELVRGSEFANKLRVVLNESLTDDDTVSAEDLVMKIINSFANTLSILNSGESDEVSQFPANNALDSPCWDGRKSEDSGESCKSSALKDRRGCYKRRKGSNSWTRDSSTLIDDGHAWRKYGQKIILNAKYPRSYFRCTHKVDQGCQATKQVQRIGDDPPLFRSTYYGHHTCKNLLKASQIVLDSTVKDSSILLSFNSDLTNKQDNPFFSSSFPSVKQEFKDEVVSHYQHHQSSSSDYLLSPDLTTFDSSGQITMLSSDHADVISGVSTDSTDNLELGMMVGSVDFEEDVLQFEF